MNLRNKYVLSFTKLLVISSLIIESFFSLAISQEVGSILNFAEHLYSKGYYDDAITEFYRVTFWGKDKTQLSSAYFGMGLCYREISQWEKAFQAFQLSMRFANCDSLIQKIKIANAATYIAAGKNDQAQIELIMIAHTSNIISLKRQAVILLITSAILQQDWKKTKTFLDQFSKFINDYNFINDINKVLTEALNHKKKSSKTAKWFSTLLPGLGQIYAKDYRNSLNAFLFNALNFTATGLFLYREEYSSAILYFIFLTERYYSGNLYQAQQSVIKYETKTDERYLRKLLTIIKENNSILKSNHH